VLAHRWGGTEGWGEEMDGIAVKKKKKKNEKRKKSDFLAQGWKRNLPHNGTGFLFTFPFSCSLSVTVVLFFLPPPPLFLFFPHPLGWKKKPPCTVRRQ
jgi:hypothetical protein